MTPPAQFTDPVAPTAIPRLAKYLSRTPPPSVSPSVPGQPGAPRPTYLPGLGETDCVESGELVQSIP